MEQLSISQAFQLVHISSWTRFNSLQNVAWNAPKVLKNHVQNLLKTAGLVDKNKDVELTPEEQEHKQRQQYVVDTSEKMEELDSRRVKRLIEAVEKKSDKKNQEKIKARDPEMGVGGLSGRRTPGASMIPVVRDKSQKKAFFLHL